MKKLKRLFLTALLPLIAMAAYGADRTVSGTVSDTSGEPLVGVSIAADKSSARAVSDIDGKFTIHIPEGKAVLKVSYIGYMPKDVNVAPDENYLNIVMEDATKGLEELVVVGYGKQKKANLTGAVTSIDGKSFEDRPATNVSNMLQGAVAGLNVTTNSGLPGSSASLNIRGQASINGGSPMVLIDGAPGSIDNINPNDVESISVIKDASAAAVYGARAAFGVILVTTKNGTAKNGKALVRYSGRFGWQEPTTSKEYENTGYWSVYLVNQFFMASNNGTKPYISYDARDMQELLARVNDKTEHPDRPWVVTEDIPVSKDAPAGKRWKYYANTDWYNTLYKDKYFSQQHNLSLSGGNNAMRYFLSGGMKFNDGLVKINGDKYKRYNLRGKMDFDVNKWIHVGNNTSIFGSNYHYQGFVESAMQMSSRHALACYPLTNPDGSYLYQSAYQTYKIANGRHISYMEGKHPGIERKTDFANTTNVVYKPVSYLTFNGDFTYRFLQNRNTNRRSNMPFRVYPEQPMQYYVTGAGEDGLQENIATYNYYSANGTGTFKKTFNKAHNVTVMAGYNYETRNYKRVYAYGNNLISDKLNDFDLVGAGADGKVITGVEGGQNEYALQGIFGRANYDFMGKYLVEISGRYDGSSRFAKGHRWGMFPSGSLGWRFSEEKFMQPFQPWFANGKLRLSYGSLGNQNVGDYYTFLRKVGAALMDAGDGRYNFSFGDGYGTYATLGSPIAANLSWETAHQYNIGLDLGFFNNRLSFTGDAYIRDTKDMLAPGVALPSLYGASSPKMNVADLRTKGFELALNWEDNFSLLGKPFIYGFGFNLSDYKSVITKYDNKDKTFSKDYYVGMELGELWLYQTDGFFKTNEEAAEYTSRIDHSYNNMSKYVGKGWQAGDVKFVDRDGDGKIGVGKNTADKPGDRYKYGNMLPRLQYGLRANASYAGFDFNIFFQGTGNHYYYPNGYTYDFWGCYSWSYLTFIPKDFKDKIWSEDNPNAYFPRVMGYQTTGGYLKDSFANDMYVQNLRYLRLKNLTVGYTLPQKWTRKAFIDKARFYFSGENLCYWSPIKKTTKYIDPESVGTHSDESNNMFYPWSKSFMFGLDITF